MYIKKISVVWFLLPFLAAGIAGADGTEKMKADPQNTFAAYYTEDPLTIQPAIPAYSLPLDPSTVSFPRLLVT